MWVAAALALLVVLRFVVRWADATDRLPAAGVALLVLAALVTGVVLLLRQTRKNR